MTTQTVLSKVKLSLRIVTDALDDEIMDLIESAKADLALVGVSASVLENLTDYPLALTAVTTYVKIHFGEPAEPERLKKSYDEQKAQMMMARGYIDRARGGAC